MLTVLDVLRRTAEFFTAKGIPTARLDAELLVGHALALPRMQLYLQFERPLQEAELERIRGMVRRRGGREPLQYIVGEVEFFGLKLKVDRRALIPRPETERLVEVMVERAQPPPETVLDLGTGTGAIALALASAWPGCAVTGVDASEEALALAAENAATTGLAGRVSLLRSHWFSALASDAAFTLIVSNPPYLSERERAEATPEVREHEPALALTSAENGLADIRILLEQGRSHVVPGGWMALETGQDQRGALEEMARRSGWARVEFLPDLAGRSRYLIVG